MIDTKKLRQKILDLAIRGKLVPQNPNDEPASVLLERIRAEKERLISEGKIKRPKKAKSSSSESHYQNFTPPFEIPDSWEWSPIEEIFQLNPKNDITDDTKCGFVPMSYVQDGFGYSHSFEEKKWHEVKKGYNHFQNGDIGIAKISPCFENRKSTIFYDLPNGLGAGTTELTILRSINHVDICNDYFLYLFQSLWYIKEGTKDFTGVVGQQRVSKDIFSTLCVPIPPKNEQRNIAKRIKEYFAVIDRIENDNFEIKECISRLKSKIIELAMQGKLVPQEPSDEPAADMLRRINPKAKIITDNPHSWKEPEGWIFCSLKDLIISPSSKPYQILQSEIRVTGLIPVISQSSNFIEGYSDDKGKAFRPSNGIVIFGDHTKNVKYFSDIFVIGADGVKLIDWSFNKNFLYYLIKYVADKIPTKGYSRHFQYLTLYIVGLPPLNEQKRIVAKIEELYACLDKIRASLQS